MIDLQSENIIRLHDARKLPWFKGRSGGRPDIGTLRRWALKGVRGVVLETVRIGATTFTSVESCLRFVERLSQPQASTPNPAAQRRRAIADADRRLDDAGII